MLIKLRWVPNQVWVGFTTEKKKKVRGGKKNRERVFTHDGSRMYICIENAILCSSAKEQNCVIC